MSRPENPSAFPLSDVSGADGCGIREGTSGMSLRDWFAGQALVGMATWTPCPPEGWPVGQQDQGHIQRVKAEWAYTMADAMLAERATREQEDAADAALL